MPVFWLSSSAHEGSNTQFKLTTSREEIDRESDGLIERVVASAARASVDVLIHDAPPQLKPGFHSNAIACVACIA